MTKQNTDKPKSTALAPYHPTPLALRGTPGSLEEYIRAANAAPLLSEEREKELAVKLRDHGDLEAASELITSHLRLVISIARQYLGYGLPFPDLIQEGNIGLMKAVRRFDPDNGARLVTFAMTWIRAEIQDYVIKNWKLVKVATTKAQRKLFFNLRSMKEGSEALTTEQTNKIAQDLEVRPADVKEMELRLLGHDVSLDEPPVHEEDDKPMEDWLEAEGPKPPASVGAVMPGYAVDSSAIIMMPGLFLYAVAVASLRTPVSKPNSASTPTARSTCPPARCSNWLGTWAC